MQAAVPKGASVFVDDDHVGFELTENLAGSAGWNRDMVNRRFIGIQ